MRVIAVCNQKGGVAKTTTTVNLAAFLARDHGRRILVIDADGQCNTTALFEPDAGLPRDTLADLLRMPQNERTEFSVSFWLGTCIVPSSFPGVDLLPGDPTLQALDLSKAEDGEAFTAVLARGLPDLGKRYDYVLIDCPPAFNAASSAALLAADEVLIPIKLDAFAISGMAALSVQLDGMRRLNPRLKVLGLLPVMWYRSETTGEAEAALRESGLPVLPRIRRSNRVDDMTFAMEPLCSCAPKSAAAKDYRLLARRIEQQKGGTEDGEV
ncbi:MAG: ParA family protein [Oscillospiraceae bacterium]|nr:ParA family protein [Oscillospiraceae bacterium]